MSHYRVFKYDTLGTKVYYVSVNLWIEDCLYARRFSDKETAMFIATLHNAFVESI